LAYYRLKQVSLSLGQIAVIVAVAPPPDDDDNNNNNNNNPWRYSSDEPWAG
jgi:hypothetical protein